jgi:hypothetical protein
MRGSCERQCCADGLAAAPTRHTAVRNGHAHRCYEREQQCPWDASSPSDAAYSRHVGLLRWLVDSGCPCDEYSLCTSAAVGGSVEVLLLLQQRGFMTRASTLTDMLHDAGRWGRLAAAKWLREQGAQWPASFQGRPWSGAVLAWARAEGCTTPIN